jgi:diaminopimelate epimerase
MADVKGITETPVGTTLDTGSPHLVVEAIGLMNLDVVQEGRKLRNSSLFLPNGINVNFIEKRGAQVFIRTYERGVEDETLSCGTGAIAAAIASALDTPVGTKKEVGVQCQGGKLGIRFQRDGVDVFSNVWLLGETQNVFEGSWNP